MQKGVNESLEVIKTQLQGLLLQLKLAMTGQFLALQCE
jgi:hypothetical protein